MPGVACRFDLGLNECVRCTILGAVMPTIAELGSIQIRIYPRDHMPPLFHISTTYGQAMMRISDLSLMKGRLRRRDLALVRDWAKLNRQRIEDGWNEQN